MSTKKAVKKRPAKKAQPKDSPEMLEAAAEIQRLRDEVKALRKALECRMDVIQAIAENQDPAEIQRLQGIEGDYLRQLNVVGRDRGG